MVGKRKSERKNTENKFEMASGYILTSDKNVRLECGKSELLYKSDNNSVGAIRVKFAVKYSGFCKYKIKAVESAAKPIANGETVIEFDGIPEPFVTHDGSGTFVVQNGSSVEFRSVCEAGEADHSCVADIKIYEN